MIRRSAAALTVVLALWGVGPSPSATAQTDDRPGPARAVLDNARAVLSGELRGDATQALLRLRHALPALKTDEARSARALLARPAQPNVLCGAHSCIHWKNPGLLGGGDAPPQDDDNGDGRPDWVEKTLQVLEASWRREVDELGYRAPLADAQPTGLPKNDIPKIDAYLQNLGGQGIYGYAATESGGKTASAYLVLDNDYAEFGTAPVKALKATAAHELFHAVQFAYDTHDAGWMMESTATWAEEQVFDGVGDNLNYLPSSSLRNPSLPLTSQNGGTEYGNWIFYQYVSEHHGARVIRNLWWRASRPGVDGRTAIAGALRRAGTRLNVTWGRFSTASNIPRRSYEEGHLYPHAAVNRTWNFGPGLHGTGWQSVSLDALTAANFVFRTGNLSGSWKLRVKVDTPGNAYVSHLLVHLRTGGVDRVRLPNNDQGNGIRIVAFSPGKVRKVTLDVASAASSNNKTVRFRATAIR